MITLTVHHKTNPVPYTRTTQGQKYVDKNYYRYVNWKNTILKAFADKYGKYPHMILRNNVKYYVTLKIFFNNKKHGDSDNVFKGVLDAIFQKPLSDKYVAGSFDFFYDDNPRVEITIKEQGDETI